MQINAIIITNTHTGPDTQIQVQIYPNMQPRLITPIQLFTRAFFYKITKTIQQQLYTGTCTRTKGRVLAFRGKRYSPKLFEHGYNHWGSVGYE